MTPLPESAPLYPPTVPRPADALPLWKFLPTFLRNPLRTVPEPVYHEPLFAPARLGGRVAWVTAPAIIEHILLDAHEKHPKSPIERRIFAPILGGGILLAEGKDWRWQRRTAAPLFRHADLLGFVPAFDAAARRVVEGWRRAPSRTRRAIDRDMTDVTFDALTRTIFIGASPEEGEALKHHISAYLERTSWDIALELVAVPPHVWHPGKPAMRRHARALSETVGGIIARERAKGWPGGGLIARLGTARDPETGQPMPDDVFANNLLTFAAAGHETTAKALSWTLYLLARAPIWQDRVRQEIDRVVGRGDIREDHLDRLPWTRQVLQESMRLYPPAPVIARRVMETTTIAGHTFAPGTMLVVPIFALHRHRQLWRDPDRFDPTRFAPENERAIARTQYMPFGFGPRTCIGMSFAMIEATVLLARFISRARFTCDPGLNPEPVSRVTLRAKGGIALSIEML